MRAVVVHGPGDLRIDERPDPVPGPGEVLLALEWGGICGSDVAYFKHGGSGTATLRHPLVLGHEVAGRIAGTGPGVSGLAEGRPVTVHPAELVGDGRLPDRLAGRTNLYPRVRYFGSAAFDPHTDGGFSEYRVVRAAQIRPLPEGVSTEQGALAEPLAVAMHAVRRAGAAGGLAGGASDGRASDGRAGDGRAGDDRTGDGRAGDGRAGDLRGRTVLVNGAGPIGSLVVAAAKHRGAATVIAADVSAASLAVARAMGADETVDVSDGTALPRDVELVFEASGAPAALGPVLRATAPGGTVVQVGNLPGAAVAAALGDLVTREITWIGSYRFVEEIDDALLAMRDGLDVSPVISHRFGLEEAARALATAADPASGSSKVMLRLGAAPGGR